jgi:acetylornithine deacetylase
VELERAIELAMGRVAERRDALVDLASQLITFDTTARDVGDPPREEAALQSLLARRLGAAGAEVELWEPDPATLAGSRQIPTGWDFAGRPQLIGRFGRRGGGRSLIFNGHIDAVSAEPLDAWRHPPFDPCVIDGRLYGRGACDMKGGVAAMVIAAEVVAELDATGGDLIVNTVTDEESCGAGGAAVVAHGLRADAAIVPEDTDFDVWAGCRGVLSPTVTVLGRAGHAEIRQRPWQEGGAVNAIERSLVVLEAARGLRERWMRDPAHQHPYLSAPDLVPTLIRGGEWWVTYPERCSITFDVTYLPVQADTDGWGTRVEQEIEAALAEAAAADDWLAGHPLQFAWSGDLPPAEIPTDHPLVRTLQAAAARVGRKSRVSGLDSWHDAATFARFGGTPAVSFGPPGTDVDGNFLAHTIDEYVPVDGLVSCAQALAAAALAWTWPDQET